MDPDHCYTNWNTAKPPSEQPGAIWTFHDERSARDSARMLREQGDRARVHRRSVSVEGCTIAVWCVTVRPAQVSA